MCGFCAIDGTDTWVAAGRPVTVLAMNRLASELSPYLRQHADNPVDWYAWGPEAFDEARRSDRPIFLSIGYSACHWCHVMAHESFEDPATAAMLNERFVSVKVDREERPDVDAVYMEAVQAMTGSGGWPLTAFLTPDGEPFFTGTYFPPRPSHGHPAFQQVLQGVHEAWTERRDELVEQAASITAHLNQSSLPTDGAVPSQASLAGARDALLAQHDPAFGGFGGAPKFPPTMSLELLLRHHVRSGGDRPALAVVTHTLDAMAAGGIHDHIGGGFSRYSVDPQWLVPHFEKMLYDEALIARAFLHAWQVTGTERYRTVLDDTLTYVLRDLRHPSGGFFAAEDADSEGVEGKFYVWSPAEVREVLGADPTIDVDEVLGWWGVTEIGNFEGANILNRIGAPVDTAEPASVTAARPLLFDARELRVRPGLDDKVLTEWNALMLATLAEAGAATDTQPWVDAAVANGEFLLAHLRADDGTWLRSWQDDGAGGRAQHPALAADHAALVDAFVRLAEATGQARWIAEAVAVADALLDRFWDADQGGLFTTAHDGEVLVARSKDLLDNATPSANSLAAVALLRLGALTGEDRYRDRAVDIIALLGSTATRHPTALAHLLGAVDLVVNGVTEVVVMGEARPLVHAAQAAFTPHAVLAWGEPYPSPLWEGRQPALAYVCENFTCQAPVETVDDLLAQLTLTSGSGG